MQIFRQLADPVVVSPLTSVVLDPSNDLISLNFLIRIKITTKVKILVVIAASKNNPNTSHQMERNDKPQDSDQHIGDIKRVMLFEHTAHFFENVFNLLETTIDP